MKNLNEFHKLAKTNLKKILSEINNKDTISHVKIAYYYTKLDSLLFDILCEINWRKNIKLPLDKKWEYAVILYSKKLQTIYSNTNENIKENLDKLMCDRHNERHELKGNNIITLSPPTFYRLKNICLNQLKSEPKATEIRRKPEDLKQTFIKIMRTNDWKIKKHWLNCNIHEQNGFSSSLTCLSGYKKTPNILWYNNFIIGDDLVLWHELAHVMHYNLAMENQSFYQFEPSILVKEIIAFFWEALSLVYITQTTKPDEAKAFWNAYKEQSDWYIKNAGDLEKENKVEYGSYYPLARATGERLALALLDNRVSRKQIIDYMCMGEKLTATTLIQAAGLKNDDEPITTN
ncbi:hypothetical protein [Vibrio sp. TRT 2004]|uniref:hypothetical protein n=1 Tax=Vibrio sp. TRT 2004 TaxID=3418506 RepID=UPI003CF15DB6